MAPASAVESTRRTTAGQSARPPSENGRTAPSSDPWTYCSAPPYLTESTSFCIVATSELFTNDLIGATNMTSAIATPETTRTTWAIDPSHSNVEFSVRHLMISSVKGRFTDVQGTVAIDEANPSDSVVEVTIGAASIDTREPQRDAHLRSADFFETEAHPSLTFRSRSIA